MGWPANANGRLDSTAQRSCSGAGGGGHAEGGHGGSAFARGEDTGGAAAFQPKPGKAVGACASFEDAVSVCDQHPSAVVGSACARDPHHQLSPVGVSHYSARALPHHHFALLGARFDRDGVVAGASFIEGNVDGSEHSLGGRIERELPATVRCNHPHVERLQGLGVAAGPKQGFGVDSVDANVECVHIPQSRTDRSGIVEQGDGAVGGRASGCNVDERGGAAGELDLGPPGEAVVGAGAGLQPSHGGFGVGVEADFGQSSHREFISEGAGQQALPPLHRFFHPSHSSKALGGLVGQGALAVLPWEFLQELVVDFEGCAGVARLCK